MKALIIYGGWDGHTPEQTSRILEHELKAKGMDVEVSTTLDSLLDLEKLKGLDVIIPQWTMGTISQDQWNNLNKAVHDFGVGLAGCHGGTGDAFRGNLDYEWMVGGHFVGHPYVGDYQVRLTAVKDPITAGLLSTFPYKSEQYYMMVDPVIRVLAETTYHYEGKDVTMPVVWTKSWGRARVFYSALGHDHKEFTDNPHVLAMTIRGFLWAAEGKKAALHI